MFEKNLKLKLEVYDQFSLVDRIKIGRSLISNNYFSDELIKVLILAIYQFNIENELLTEEIKGKQTL